MSVVIVIFYLFFFKQKTAYEMRISDWSSDVCSSDLTQPTVLAQNVNGETPANGRYQNLIEEGAPPLEFYAQPSSVLAPLPTVPSERPSQPLLVLQSVAPSVEDLDNLQSMQLMQESRSNSDLAEIGRAHVGTPVTNAHHVCL